MSEYLMLHLREGRFYELEEYPRFDHALRAPLDDNADEAFLIRMSDKTLQVHFRRVFIHCISDQGWVLQECGRNDIGVLIETEAAKRG